MDQEKKEEKKQPINLFNNPMIDAAVKSIDPEVIEEYQNVGKYMYSTTDFEKSLPKVKDIEHETSKGVFYVTEALKAGIHPQELSGEEIQLMYDIYGPKWYEAYDWDKSEVPEPKVVIDPEKKKHDLPTKKELDLLERKAKKKKFFQEMAKRQGLGKMRRKKWKQHVNKL